MAGGDILRDRKVLLQAIYEAENAVIKAAHRWYDSRNTESLMATASLALAVQALRELEAQDAAKVR